MIFEGERLAELKASAKTENFVYTKTMQRHDLSELKSNVERAFNKAEMIRTRFYINTKDIDYNDYYYACDEAFEDIKKAYNGLIRDMRSIRKQEGL